jgi:transcriptional regulator GlxA family with amidase domain
MSASLGSGSDRRTTARPGAHSGGRTADEPRRVVVVGYRGAELLDIACVTTTFAMANVVGNGDLYDTVVVTPGGGPMVCVTGLTVLSQGCLEKQAGPVDTLIISGGLGHEDAAADRRLVAHVRRLAHESRRIASVCTGADILAAAGLLDGRRAATHWDRAAHLSALYPRVTFDPRPIFVRDGPVATSAGVTASLDLSLAFVEEDAGIRVARDVARQLVTYLQRPGNQAQMSVFTAAPAPSHDLVRRTVEYVSGHLGADLSGPALASRAGVSERHLSRLFVDELDLTPGRYVRRARLEAAAHLLTTSDLTMEAVSARCGYGNAESLRQAFFAAYGVSPSHYRSTQAGWIKRADAEGVPELDASEPVMPAGKP